MSAETLKKAFDLIEQHKEKSDFEEPKSESLVQSGEKVLGLTFPPTYRAFLKKYGCGGMGSLEVYGLIDDNFENSRCPNGIWVTLNERKLKNLPSFDYYFPHHLVVIAADGMGGLYVIDTSKKNTDLESPIVIWDPGVSTINDKLEKIADDFGDFLLTSIEAALKRNEETPGS